VLGYSNGSAGLHKICAARLRRAESVAGAEDVVLLSGWARRPARLSEAELMARAWRGGAARLIVSGDARTTFGNARAAARTSRLVRPSEVVLVTSPWHQRRASALFRVALRGSGARLVVAATDERRNTMSRLRELACWTLVPLQVVLMRARR
jgi:uncharacterized SAM-binding protein YcdF (DUF218 family)